MRHGSEIPSLDRLGLIDEQLYEAYRRAQRTPHEAEQRTIADEILEMQRQRTALLSDLLSRPRSG